MKPHHPHADPELNALLEEGKVIERVPDVVRARALSRVHATLAVIAAIPHEPLPFARRRGLTIALAASLALAVGATAVASVILGRAPGPSNPAPSTFPHANRPVSNTARELSPSAPIVALPSVLPTKSQRSGRLATAQESYAAELRLLQRAQVAYGAREFSEALALVAEHGRIFPSGRLAEEREALHVRALSGAGRTEEATRVAAAFATRFPRSILLPRLSGEFR